MTKLFSNELISHLSSTRIVYSPVEKLYFKQYLYKVTLKSNAGKYRISGYGHYKYLRCSIPLADVNAAESKLQEFVLTAEHFIEEIKAYRDVVAWVDDNFSKTSIRTHKGTENIIFYMRDPEDVLTLCKRFPKLIGQINGPMNESHVDTLKNGNNIIIRSDLFYKKYRYRCRYKVSADFLDHHHPRLVQWLKTLDEDVYQAARFLSIAQNKNLPKRLYFNNYKYVSIYLTELEHLVYARLLSGNSLIDADEVKLVSDIS